MEKMSDKGPIFAQAPEGSGDADVMGDVLEVMGNELAWAAQDLLGDIMADLVELWKVGPRGVESVREFLHRMARASFAPSTIDAEMRESIRVVLRESRKLMARGA